MAWFDSTRVSITEQSELFNYNLMLNSSLCWACTNNSELVLFSF